MLEQYRTAVIAAAKGTALSTLQDYLDNPPDDIAHEDLRIIYTEALMQAVHYDDYNYPRRDTYTKTIKLLVQAGADVNTCDEDGCTPLMHVVSFKYWMVTEKAADHLIEAGALVNITNNSGMSLFRRAIRGDKRYAPWVRYLREKGAILDHVEQLEAAVCTFEFERAAELVSQHGDQSLAIHLITFIAVKTPPYLDALEQYAPLLNVNALNENNRTALMATTLYADQMQTTGSCMSQIAKILIARGINVNHVGWYGETALLLAAGYGEADSIHNLVQAGANVNAAWHTTGNTPIHLAVTRSKPEIFIALCQGGANAFIANKASDTAISLIDKLEDKKAAAIMMFALQACTPLPKMTMHNVELLYQQTYDAAQQRILRFLKTHQRHIESAWKEIKTFCLVSLMEELSFIKDYLFMSVLKEQIETCLKQLSEHAEANDNQKNIPSLFSIEEPDPATWKSVNYFAVRNEYTEYEDSMGEIIKMSKLPELALVFDALQRGVDFTAVDAQGETLYSMIKKTDRWGYFERDALEFLIKEHCRMHSLSHQWQQFKAPYQEMIQSMGLSNKTSQIEYSHQLFALSMNHGRKQTQFLLAMCEIANDDKFEKTCQQLLTHFSQENILRLLSKKNLFSKFPTHKLHQVHEELLQKIPRAG